MGTRTVFLPSERMILSSLTISPKFFLIASRIFSLWRSWSACPLRCNDQSCWETDMGLLLLVAKLLGRDRLRPTCLYALWDARQRAVLHPSGLLSIQQTTRIA